MGGLVLAGDVGGTKTHLGVFRAGAGERPERLRQATYASAAYPSLASVLAEFLRPAEVGQVAAASFGIAGPVLDNTCVTTNLPWRIVGAEVAAVAAIPRLTLLNDLVALAEGIPALADPDVLTLQAGSPEPEAGAVLIAAGTGLGMALLAREGSRFRPLPSEGGHADFAPRDEEEMGLLRYLRRRLRGRVSVERVVSGPGLADLYAYLKEIGYAVEQPDLVRATATPAAAQAISAAALAGRCPMASRALDLFVSAYGAAAGNLALVGMALGGVYVGGGIAPKIRERLAAGGFLAAFLDKGRFRALLERMPVRVILDPEAGLLGAARHALRSAAAAR